MAGYKTWWGITWLEFLFRLWHKWFDISVIAFLDWWPLTGISEHFYLHISQHLQVVSHHIDPVNVIGQDKVFWWHSLVWLNLTRFSSGVCPLINNSMLALLPSSPWEISISSMPMTSIPDSSTSSEGDTSSSGTGRKCSTAFLGFCDENTRANSGSKWHPQSLKSSQCDRTVGWAYQYWGWLSSLAWHQNICKSSKAGPLK